MQLTSRTWLSALVLLPAVVGFGLSPPADAGTRQGGVVVMLKGHWARTAYNPGAQMPAKLAQAPCQELPKPDLTFAWATIDTDGQAIWGAGQAYAQTDACGIVMAGVADHDATSATYMRTDGLPGWVEVEVTAQAGSDVNLIGKDSAATLRAEVCWISDLVGEVCAETRQSLNTNANGLGLYQHMGGPNHGHGCAALTSFRWSTATAGSILVSAQYVPGSTTPAHSWAQLWKCAVTAMVCIRDLSP